MNNPWKQRSAMSLESHARKKPASHIRLVEDGISSELHRLFFRYGPDSLQASCSSMINVGEPAVFECAAIGC